MVPTGRDICTAQLYALIDKIKNVEVDEHQIEPFLPEIYSKLESLSREQLIKHFVSAEFNRFLTYYKNARDINIQPKGSKGQERSKDRPARERRGRVSDFERLFINVGSANKLSPHRLIGVVNEALDSSSADIGKIEIMKKFSFFEIDKSVVPELMKSIQGSAFEGIDLVVEPSKEKPSGAFLPKKKKSKKGKDERPARKKGGGKRGGRDRR
ncbi:MAG: DbpA RNA binding domain-containing protein [Saprospiraceae bacterium]